MQTTEKKNDRTSPNDELLKAFGEMSVEFSQLEDTLIFWTATLINAKELDAGYAELAGMTMADIEKRFKTLVTAALKARPPLRASSDEIQKRMDEVMDSLKEVRDARNRYIHSRWSLTYVFDEDTENVIESGEAELTYRPKKKLPSGEYILDITKCTAPEVEAVAKDIRKASSSLHAFVEETNSLLGDALFRSGFFRFV